MENSTDAAGGGGGGSNNYCHVRLGQEERAEEGCAGKGHGYPWHLKDYGIIFAIKIGYMLQQYECMHDSVLEAPELTHRGLIFLPAVTSIPYPSCGCHD